MTDGLANKKPQTDAGARRVDGAAIAHGAAETARLGQVRARFQRRAT